MKSVLSLVASAALIAAKELPKNEELAAELYDSGVMHETNMANKLVRIRLHSFDHLKYIPNTITGFMGTPRGRRSLRPGQVPSSRLRPLR